MISTQPSIFSSAPKHSSRHARKRASTLRHETRPDRPEKPDRFGRDDDTKSHHRPAKPVQRPRRASSPQLGTKSHRRDSLYVMTVDSMSITELAAYARTLLRRAKTSGPDFAQVATVVRSLHTVIKHLRAEAEDPDSLLNRAQQESSVYARQLSPIIEDTDFTLKQLDTILKKYGSSPSDESTKDSAYGADKGAQRLEDRERDMLQLIRTKLSNQKTHIDIFLDTVQLHNPSRQHRPVNLEQTDDKQQNSIKDKIDAVAARCFQRRAEAKRSGDSVEDSEEDMWQLFWAELVKEGFSSEVLRKHKEVLRAYTRELEANGSTDENPPSVRGLLDHANGGSAYAPQQFLSYPDTPAPAYGSRQQYGSPALPPPPVAIPSSYPSGDPVSAKELVSPALDNAKYAPEVKLERRRPEQDPSRSNADGHCATGQYNPDMPPSTSAPVLLPWERSSSDSASDTDSSNTQKMALISTRDLIESDQRNADALAARVGALHLSPQLAPNYGVSPGTSPIGRYLPPPSTYHGQPNYSPGPCLSSSPALQHSEKAPRYVPALGSSVPAYGSSLVPPAMMTPPPGYSPADPVSAIPSSAPPAASGFPPPTTGGAAAPRRSRLAPDSTGAEIPLDAKWTRIKRALVSPEVLDKLGFRYEARPDFVAVLGELSRHEIANIARKSAEIRASRVRGSSFTKPPGQSVPTVNYPEKKRHANGSGRKTSRQPDTTDDDSVSSYPIWDESDTSSDSESDSPHSRMRSSRSSQTDKYIPRDVRRHRRERRDSVIQEEPVLEDAYDNDSNDGSNRKGRSSRVYPVIVPPPLEKGSPAATVAPKPILKNRNENHVRFDPEGPREMSSGEFDRERERRERRARRRAAERDGDRRRDRERDRDRDHDRDHDRDRDRDRDRRDRERSDRDHDRDRDRDRDRSDRHRERDRDRDRDAKDHHSSRHRDRGEDGGRSDRRRTRKSVWGETLGAVGMGGAAATLLSVLTEAAVGL